MVLAHMTPGGRWVRPPHDAPPVYVPPKQLEAHFKRLIADGWMPTDDPRREETRQEVKSVEQPSQTEAELRAQVQALQAQLEATLAANTHAAREVKPAAKTSR